MSNFLIIPESVMPQRSDEWLAWRKTLAVSGSGAKVKAIVRDPSIHDGDPKSWQDVWDGVEAPWTDEAEKAASFGRRHEDAALQHFNEIGDTGLVYEPICVEVGFEGQKIGASLDGYAWDPVDGVHRFVEIKCPAKLKTSATWRHADKERVPPWYLWQVAMQSLCLEFGDAPAIGVFFVYIPRGRGGPDFRAVQLDEHLLGARMDHLYDYIGRFIRREPEPELWAQTAAGRAENTRAMND